MSSVPSEFRRAKRLRDVPLKLVKSPPIKILPSDCTARVNTGPFAPAPEARKELSSEPSAFKRAMLLRAVPLMLAKLPPTKNPVISLNSDLPYSRICA